MDGVHSSPLVTHGQTRKPKRASTVNVFLFVNVIYLPTVHRRAQELVTTCTWIKNELEFRASVFVEGGKPENPEKNPRSKNENQQQTQRTYGTGPESNPGHISGRRALSPLRHPCSLIKYRQ